MSKNSTLNIHSMIGSAGYQPPAKQRNVMNWESQSPRRFEYQSANKVNEHRFELIKLPEISTKHKKSLAFEYDRKRALDAPAGIDSHLIKEPNRAYKVKYDLV